MNLLRKLFLVLMFVGFLTGAAFSFAEAWNAPPQPESFGSNSVDLRGALAGAGDCYANSGGGGPADDKDEEGDNGWSIVAESGNVITSACIKTGKGGDAPAYFQTSSNGIISISEIGCYRVSGIGTNTLTITQLVTSSICKEISHIEAKWQQPTFTSTSTIFIPVTGGLSLIDPCTTRPGIALAWQVVNTNSVSVSFLWWVVGGTTSGGPIVAPANSTVNFETPIDGPLPNRVAIMWLDPFDGATRSISEINNGEACTGVGTTPTPTATLGSLIPVTGGVMADLFGQSMLLNLGIGIIGAALILVGIGIKVDRDRRSAGGR